MYAVEVRDRIMIAHSLPDPFFGPAQNMHGATFVVDVAFFRETLTKQNVVVDIGAALDVLNKTLKPLAYQNLDALPQFKGKLTTTEFLCRYVFDAMAKAAKDGRARRGRQGPRQDPRHAARDRPGARLVRGAGVGADDFALPDHHHRCP